MSARLDDTTLSTEPEQRPHFWARQFRGPYTGGQWWFDLVFGLVLPPMCMLADPIVFVWDSTYGTGGLSDWAFFVYFATGISWVFLASWLLLWPHLGGAAALWSGALGVAAAAALAIGVLLLPITIVGLLAIIGVLGLAPFGTFLAYFRSAHLAWTQAAKRRSRTYCVGLALVGALIVVGPPAAADAYVNRLAAHAAMALPTASAQETESIIARLDAVPWCTAACGRPLVDAFERAREDTERERLRAGFRALTGREVSGYLQPPPGSD